MDVFCFYLSCTVKACCFNIVSFSLERGHTKNLFLKLDQHKNSIYEELNEL